MRILALSNWFPYPPDNGARMRIHNLLRQLAQRHEIVLLSFTGDTPSVQNIDAVRTYCREVTAVPFRRYQPRRLKALLGFFQPSPRDVVDTYSLEMERLVRQKLADEPFDIVAAFATGLGAGTAPCVRGMREVPRIIEELQLSIIKDRIAIQPHWYQRLRLRLTWWKLRNYAAGLLRDMNGCTVSSTREQDLLLSILPDYRPLAVISNGVDLTLYDGDFSSVEPDSLVFPGALTYKANYWAAKFFLAEVFPVVKARCPSVKLYITGRTDGVLLGGLPLQDGVVLTGYLDDIRPRVACSSICVVPITVGGGTRLKILEAMALGTPVVSTNKGAEGLEVTPGQDILIADEPTEFANAVLQLLDDPALREKLAANGRKLVQERYGWNRIGKKLESFLCQVVERHREAESK
jgi:glycosyltransferase involved in cell wall biosynthesis